MSMTQSLAAIHAHVMLDHDYGVAGLHQSIELNDQPFNIRWMQSRGGLIENVEWVTTPTLQLRGKLNTLGFPTGKFGRRLAEP
jgi:hypothetical protein